jgi:hypothetical protein
LRQAEDALCTAVQSSAPGRTAGQHQMSDVPGTMAGGYRDATGNGADATAVALDASARAEGIIGQAARLVHEQHQWLAVSESTVWRLLRRTTLVSAKPRGVA